MDALTLIGYWHGEGQDDGLPDPADLVDGDWDDRTRSNVVEYLRGGMPVLFMMGYSTCRICGVQNGAAEQTDGTYLWPEGLAHYVADHHVRLPEPVIEHMQARFFQLDGQAVESHQRGTRQWTDLVAGMVDLDPPG